MAPKTYIHNPHLFRPEPPDEVMVKRLFRGRETVLKSASATFKAGLDIEGRKFVKGAKTPWIIHGESRSGKSHLARRILADYKDTGPRIESGRGGGIARLKRIILAREKLEALHVMWDVFDDLASRMNELEPFADGLMKDAALYRKMRNFASHIQRFKSAPLHTVEIAAEIASLAGTEAGGEIGLAWAKTTGKLKLEESSKNTDKAVLRPPSAGELAELSASIITLLVDFKIYDHVLLLFDDVDLLESHRNESHNGRKQRMELLECVHALHNAKGADVLVTARSYYANSAKDLITLVNLLELDPMSGKDLREIQAARWKAYGPKDGTAGFIVPGALDFLARDVQHLPGIYLQQLERVFRQHSQQPRDGERSYEWFLGVLTDMYRRQATGAPGAANALEKAVGSGNKTIAASEIQGSVFESCGVYASYADENSYHIPPITVEIIRRARSGESRSFGEAAP